MSKRQNYPSIAERARESICPECGAPVYRKSKTGPPPTFCKPEHKRDFETRKLTQGAAVIVLLKAWRVDRGQGPIAQASLAQVCQIVDGFNAADFEAPRPRADYYAAKLMADGRLYMDRSTTNNRKARANVKARETSTAGEN